LPVEFRPTLPNLQWQFTYRQTDVMHAYEPHTACTPHRRTPRTTRAAAMDDSWRSSSHRLPCVLCVRCRACSFFPAPGCSLSSVAHGGVGSCGQTSAGTTCSITCGGFVRQATHTRKRKDGRGGREAGQGLTTVAATSWSLVPVVCVCSGYEVSGGLGKCNSAGSWTNIPTCIPAGCGGGSIPNSVAGGCRYASLSHGQYCNFNCDDGYVLRDQGEIYGESTKRGTEQGAAVRCRFCCWRD
jgi:hypothetical protein